MILLKNGFIIKENKLIKKDDFVDIKGRGTLDKKFIIHADNFDEVAVKMIYLINGRKQQGLKFMKVSVNQKRLYV